MSSCLCFFSGDPGRRCHAPDPSRPVHLHQRPFPHHNEICRAASLRGQGLHRWHTSWADEAGEGAAHWVQMQKQQYAQEHKPRLPVELHYCWSYNITSFFFLCSRGTEHEDVGGDESWYSFRADLLHEGQDWYELQQRLHERPHPLPLQGHSPPSHRKHIQVLEFNKFREGQTT